MKKKSKAKSDKLFDPDIIATEMNRALNRDFANLTQVYGVDEYTAKCFNRQASDFLKKYCSPKQDLDRLEYETFAKFLSVNDHMHQVNKDLSLYFRSLKTDVRVCHMDWAQKVHTRAKAIVNMVLGPLTLEELFLGAKHSGGTTVGVGYADTSPERKFALPMTVTSRVQPLMDSYFSYDLLLGEAVRTLNSPTAIAEVYETVSGSRATTVDKTTEKRRMICVEPTCNMFLQQGLMHVMYNRLKKVGLDVETLPDRHIQLAKESSITGKNATIDWSSASDCVSIELLRWLLPTTWFDMVWDLRCDTTTLPDGRVVDLHMISTMGNADTFPLETLVFWAYGQAILLSETRCNTLFPEWEELCHISVFGDDCIVPTTIASRFIDTMESVGFIVNDDKSFYDNRKFRESCGGDFLAGYDVRPFTLKAPPSLRRSSLEPWLYIVLNAFVEKYILYFGRLKYVYDRELFRYVFALMQENKIKLKLVPPDFPDDSGFKCPDIERFYHCYPITLNRIEKSNHGTYKFAYCHFRYWKNSKWDDFLRYSLRLKTLRSDDSAFNALRKPRRPLPHEKPDRRKGGYVVSVAYSAHWTLPAINRRQTA